MIDKAWDWTSGATYIALLPGVLIVVALLVSGTWVAEAVARARAHRDRTMEQPKRKRSRRPNDVPCRTGSCRWENALERCGTPFRTTPSRGPTETRAVTRMWQASPRGWLTVGG